jgi:hypothetical protein
MSLSPKQEFALELLTCGLGMTYTEIAEKVGVGHQTLWRWRKQPQFKEFQDELQRRNDMRWACAEDVARSATIELCRKGNQRMVQWVMENAGYTPTKKVEANLDTTVEININD